MPFSPRPFFFLPLEEEGSEVAFPPLESWDSWHLANLGPLASNLEEFDFHEVFHLSPGLSLHRDSQLSLEAVNLGDFLHCFLYPATPF